MHPLAARAARRVRLRYKYDRSRLHATLWWRRRIRRIHAASGISLAPDGTVEWAKRPDLMVQGASTIKLLTVAVAHQVLTDLAQLRTIEPEDNPYEWAATDLLPGDTLTVADLFHAALLTSDAAATGHLALAAGTALLAGAPGDPLARFLDEATRFTGRLGWTGHTIGDTIGGSLGTRYSARQVATLLRWVQHHDPWLWAVSGKTHHALTITGGRTVDLPITNTAHAVALPEFRAGKTGTYGETTYLVAGWGHPDGSIHTLAVMGSDRRNRFLDARTIIDAATRRT